MHRHHPPLVAAVAAAALAWPAVASALPAVPQGDWASPLFGSPRHTDNIAIYPITLWAQDDIGPVVTLEEALAKGDAEVREGGAAAHFQRTEPLRQALGPSQVGTLGGPSTNTLVLENRGKVAVFVLAGTVVRGGNQDRQIGQDFIVDPGKTVAIDVFCVEHGRSDPMRDGHATGGKFGVATALATAKVRAAGQYQKNQQAVWAKVADANHVHDKHARSGTLLATLDDGDLAAKSDALAKRIAEDLGSVMPRERIVGFAFAIDGQIRGARWFAHHRVFAMYSDKLVRSAALEALTARAEAKAAGKAAAREADPVAGAVERFVADVDAQAPTETRTTTATNDNEYRESKTAYGAKTLLKGAGARGRKPVSFDYLTK